MRIDQLAYRALNPVHARDPLSGEGARIEPKRFNPPGTAALYTSLDPLTALNELCEAGSPLEPTLVVSVRVTAEPVFDAAEGPVAARGYALRDLLADDWADRTDGRLPLSQAFARALIDEGFAGLRVRSSAPGAGEGSLNLVLWRWAGRGGARVDLVDTEGRIAALPKG